MMKTIFHRILATTALCLTAMGVSSCIYSGWLTSQCQQKASYAYSAFSVPEVEAIRFVDKQGKVILEPSMNRPKIRKFADSLRDMARLAYSVEYAGGEIREPEEAEEADVALYVDLLDSKGVSFWRIALWRELSTLVLFYHMPLSNKVGHGVPLKIGLSESEVALLLKYSSK